MGFAKYVMYYVGDDFLLVYLMLLCVSIWGVLLVGDGAPDALDRRRLRAVLGSGQ